MTSSCKRGDGAQWFCDSMHEDVNKTSILVWQRGEGSTISSNCVTSFLNALLAAYSNWFISFLGNGDERGKWSNVWWNQIKLILAPKNWCRSWKIEFSGRKRSFDWKKARQDWQLSLQLPLKASFNKTITTLHSHRSSEFVSYMFYLWEHLCNCWTCSSGLCLIFNFKFWGFELRTVVRFFNQKT